MQRSESGGQAATGGRRFHVHDRRHDRHSGHVVADADDFHEAALAFAERWSDAEPDLSVIVKDCETGEEQCFVVRLDEDEAEPCG